MISSQSIRSSSTTTGSRFVALLLLFAFTWLATGCGSSSQDFVNTNTGSFVLTPETVQGKLFLGATVGGVPVQLQTVDGLVLGATVTDGAGSFTFPGPVPTNFRVVATLSDGLAFSREIRDFQGDQFVV
ncbi:MAG: hypothetical protein KC800_27475, partial [Candidatus Eremiobacteraeota bacterium]|nr:hypothetical protein [Candidatus Eremiobacteraeota bacterium]